MYSVSDETRKPIFEGVQGENEAREIQFDVTAWVEELGEGVCTATAKRPTDTAPYPVTVTRSGNVVTWKPNSTDTSIEGIGAFQLAFSINDVVAKTRIWNTKIAPSLVGAGDPPDPYDDWIQDLRDIAAETLTYSQNAENSADDAEAEKLEAEAWAKGTKNGTPVSSSDAQYQNNSKYFAEESYKNAEAWAVGQRGGVDVPSTDPTYENNAKYYAEQSAANQYGAYIVKSASGDIASFSDGADDIPMKSLKVAIVPQQAGGGDPSPSNVRPITGTSTANVFVTGKNIFDPSEVEDGYRVTSDGTLQEIAGYWVSGYIPVKAGVTYYKSQTDNGRTALYDTNKVFLSYNNALTVGTFTPAEDGYFRFTAHAEEHPIGSAVQVEVGTTATAYEPYTGHTTPVPLGQTVYGGEVDVVSGEGAKNINLPAINDISFGISAIGGHNIFRGFSYFANSQNAVGLCECLKFTTESLANMPNNSFRFSNYWDGNARLAIRADDYADVTALKSALGANKIAIPVNPYGDFTFTPASVPSLLGQNNVWSDAGAVAVEYRADPTLAYAELQALILENL